MGAEIFRTVYLSGLAEAHLMVGHTAEGLTALDEAIDFATDTGDRFWEAELHRMRGVLLLAHGAGESEAEEHFLKALEVARNQTAKSLELRAATSLARLWMRQGKKAEDARVLLQGIYGWFTEGFDTPDLIDAKALLEEFS